MPEVLEYTYEDRPDHLTDREAIERYTKMQANHPDALIMLRDLDCGHWQVRMYETEAEKNAFLRRRLSLVFRTFWSALQRTSKTP